MKRSKPLSTIAIILSIVFLCFVGLLILNKLNSTELNESQEIPREIDKSTPERGFFKGIAGFTPANFPNFREEDQIAYWNDINANAEIYGVHIELENENLLKLARQKASLPLVLVLGFQEKEKWENHSDYAEQVLSLLDTSPNIMYLGIGNEVNLIAQESPKEFEQYKQAYIQVYKKIKNEYPDLKIFPTFQLEAMNGQAYLMSGTETTPTQWDLFKSFEDYIDLAVFTSYPYFTYETPLEIPDDYFSTVEEIVNKPLALTETGWMSRQTYGSTYKYIEEQGYTGSETEQVEYLTRLENLIQNSNFEFIDWVFLNDVSDWEENTDPNQFPLFDSVGLRYNDGEAKDVWYQWQKL